MRAASPPLPESAANAPPAGRAPLIVHIIYRLDVGGLENGLVNLINRIPAERFRHAIVCLTDYSDFRRRIRRDDVPLFCLHKPPGNSLVTHLRLWRVLKQLAPDIVHTRNLAALECTLTAMLAGVRVRIHGEHGRDVDDLDGNNVGRQRLRRFFRPLVHRYVAVSQDLESYLQQKVGVPASRITQIYNGVETELFRPARAGPESLRWPRRENDGLFVIGTVGRMQEVKDPLNLVKAFILLVQALPGARSKLKLVMAGDGPLRRQALEILERAGLVESTWLPGNRDDIPAIMRGLDLFVLPSLAEGISNTLLEAMASGLPVVATRVGGNPELMEEGITGSLVPPADPQALSTAIQEYFVNRELVRRHGVDARRAVESRFGMDAMVKAYIGVYDSVLAHGAPVLSV
jgi:sugar transferase (PEP-CTERM/EpsH1 system associated)